MKNPCIAHRGWSSAAPENTLSSIRKVLAHSLVEGLEFDVQLSKDGVPVVIHDFTLDRTTDGHGLVRDYTFAELRKLDAGSWFGPEYAGEQIPSLEEVLIEAKGTKRLDLELKQAGTLYEGLEEAVISMVRAHQMQDQVIVTSFDHTSVQKVKQLAPEFTVGPIIHGQPLLIEQQIAVMGASVIAISYPYVTKKLADELLGKGIELIVWTVDDPAHMKQLAYLDERIMICTNVPERWLALVESSHRNPS